MMLCLQVKQLVEQRGVKALEKQVALARHTKHCQVCGYWLQQQTLLAALAELAAPDPGVDFESRMLERVIPAAGAAKKSRSGSHGLSHSRSSSHSNRPSRSLADFYKNFFSLPYMVPVGMAASLMLGVLLAPMLTGNGLPALPGVTQEMAAHQPSAQQFAAQDLRPVRVRLDTAKALTGATIRVRLPEHASIEGFKGVQTLQWQADIPAGGNQLSLPVQVEVAGKDALSAGHLIIEVEYRGAKKALRYAIPPAAPASKPLTNI